MIVEVTAPRRLGNGLCIYKKRGDERKIKGTDNAHKIKELCKHKEMETTISDLRGNCSSTCTVMPVQMKIKILEIK